MPRGTAFDIEVVKIVKEKTVKKTGEETLAIWTPGTGKRFRLSGFNLYAGTAEALVTLLDNATGIYQTVLPAKTNVAFTFPQGGYLSTVAENKLNLTISVENAVTACFYGVEDIA